MKTTARFLLGFVLGFAAIAAFLPSADALDTIAVDNATNVKRVTGWDWVSPSRSTDPQGADQQPKDVGVFVLDSGLAVHVYKWGNMYHPYGGFALTHSWASTTSGMTAPIVNGQEPDTTGYDLAQYPDWVIATNYFGLATPWFDAHTDWPDWHSFPYSEWAFQAGASVLHRYSSWSLVDVLVSARAKTSPNLPDFNNSRSWRVLAKSDGSAAVDLAVGDFVTEVNGTLLVTRHETNGVGASVLTIYSVSVDLSFTKVDQFLSPYGYEDPVSPPLWINTENWTPGSPQPTFYFAGASGGSYIMLPFYAGAPMLYRQDTGEAWKSGFAWNFDTFSQSMASYVSQFFGVDVSTNTSGWTVTPHLAGLVPVSILDMWAANVYFVAFQNPSSYSWALQSRRLNSAWYFSGETAPMIPSQPDFDNPLVYLPRADSTYAVLDVNCSVPGYESCQFDASSETNACSTNSGTFWRSSTNAERQCKRYVTLAPYYPTGTPSGTGATSSGVVLPYSDYEPIRDFTGWNGSPVVTNKDYLYRCIYLNPDKSKYGKPLQFCPVSDFESVNQQYWDRFCGTAATGQPARHFYFWGNYGPVTTAGSPGGEIQMAVKAGVCATAATSTGITDVSLQYAAAGNVLATTFPTIQKTSVYQYQGSHSGSYANRWLGMVNTYARTPSDFDNSTLLSFFGTDTAAVWSTGTVLPYEDVVFYNVSSVATRNAADPNDPGKTFTYFRSKGPNGDSGNFITNVRALSQIYYTDASTLTPYDDAYYLPESRPPGQSLTGGTVFGKPQYTQPSNGYKGMFSCDADHDGETTLSEWFSCPATLADHFTGEFDYSVVNWKGLATSTSDLGNVSNSQYSKGVFGEQEHSSNPMIENIVKFVSFDSAVNSKWSDENKFVRFAKYVFWMVMASVLVLFTLFFRKER